jgi:hypothetical protein
LINYNDRLVISGRCGVCDPGSMKRRRRGDLVVEASAREAHELPVAVGPGPWITVALDPAGLVDL